MEYQIVKSDAAVFLEEKVNKLLTQDWKLYGDLQVIATGRKQKSGLEDSFPLTYIQVMTRTPKD